MPTLNIWDGSAWQEIGAAGGYPLALTGATAATRYVGGTASGAPASGTFAVGDFAIAQDGAAWVCVAAGTPGTWRRTAADPLAVARITEEFVGNGTTSGTIGTHGWSVANGVTVSTASAANHPGIINRSTGASSGTNATLYLTNQGTIGLFIPSDTFDLTWVVRLNHNDANTLARVGLASATTDPPANGMYFEKLAADTNWFRVTRASSTETRTDHGTAAGTGWVKFRIRRKDASTIGYSIDGGTEADVTTNIPTAALSPWMQIVNSAASAKTIDADYLGLDIAVTR